MSEIEGLRPPFSTHQPLSKMLAKIVEKHGPEDLTLNALLQRTEGRGWYLMIILLSLPFILPISIPGTSIPFGLAVALLSLRFAFGKNPSLPGIIGNRRLSPALCDRILKGSTRVLNLVERLVHPRRTGWMASRGARWFHGLILTILGLLLATPFPPFPPLTNTLPCYSIILLASSMMEEDGVSIWAAYAACIATIVYLVTVAGLVEATAVKMWHIVHGWF